MFIFDKLNDEILKISSIVNIDTNQTSANEKTKTDDDGWEEVKKGGKRMKQVNNINSFKTSIIGKIFQGILKHELEQKGKSLSNANIEPFFILSLDFGEDSIESCFTKFFSKRKIETDKSTIFQRSYIEKLPEIFIVHLKAFYYDKNLGKILKINKTIDYGENLKISEDYFSPSVKSGYKGVEYELISGNLFINFYYYLVIIHKGTKASEGHYICFCKDENDVWWSLDDKKVIKVDSDVLVNFRPYILFYRKL